MREHVNSCLFQRGSGLQAHIRAGEPSSSSQRIPRWGVEEWLCLSRVNLPQTQVLGEECGSRTKRHHHTGASQVRERTHLPPSGKPPSLWIIGLFRRYNEVYTWTNPTCCVHNIIVGQLWIEQYGNVEVINHRWKKEQTRQNLLGGRTKNTDTKVHTQFLQIFCWWALLIRRRYSTMLFSGFLLRTGERCFLNFKPCGLFGRELHKVEGYILDKR